MRKLASLKSKLRRLDRRYLFVILFAFAGVSALIITRAASSVFDIEAENGTLSNAQKVADGTASDGNFLQFSNGQSPPLPGGSGLDFPDNPTFQRSSVSQYGMTWNFDRNYTVGQYANGDWWVVGPVTLTSITPAANRGGLQHGENINPVKGAWNYDKNIPGTSSSNFQAFSYPRTVGPGSSILKTISRPAGTNLSSHPRAALQTAAILTVVSSPPPKNGAIAFRPPYFGSGKPQYLTTNLKMNLWPSLPIPSGMAASPTLESANTRFSRVQMDFGTGSTFSERLHAADNGNVSYGGYIAQALNGVIFRLMLNEPTSQKTQGIISIVQYGIDLAPMIQAGSHICADQNPQFNCAGHGSGRHLPISIAATLLDAQPIKDVIRNNQDAFNQNFGINTFKAPTPLWGDAICTEAAYNAIFHDSNASGSRSCRDPYGYIDGGYYPGGSYQGIVTANWIGDAAAIHLMPSLKANYPQADEILRYIDRTKDFGAWTKPDPRNRDPSKHGDKSTISSSGYQSALVEALWRDQNLSNRITTNWAGL